MTSTSLDDKIRAAFGEFAVDKGLIRRMGVAGDDRHVPSYVMDWIVTYTAKPRKRPPAWKGPFRSSSPSTCLPRARRNGSASSSHKARC